MPTDKEIDKIIDRILEAISPKVVAREITIKFQELRESYTRLHKNPRTFEEAEEEIIKYGEQLHCCLFPGQRLSKLTEHFGEKEAREYLEKAFPGGGMYEACRLVEKGIRGGMKKVLDLMTDQAIAYWKKLYIPGTIDEIAGELGLETDYKSWCAVVRRYQERFPDFLSDDDRNSAPGYLITFGQWYEIFTSHAQAADKLGEATKARRKK